MEYMTASDSHMDEEKPHMLHENEEGRGVAMKLDNSRGPHPESGSPFKSELSSKALGVSSGPELLGLDITIPQVKINQADIFLSWPEDLDQSRLFSHLDQGHHPLEIADNDAWLRKGDSESVWHYGSMFEVKKLIEALTAQHKLLDSVYCELEQERSAAATAANEAVSMIARLQNEKSVLQMEARHYQQLVEAMAFCDQDDLSLLKEIILEQEVDKLALENELKLYRKRLLRYSIDRMKKEKKLGISEVVEEVFQEGLATSDEEMSVRAAVWPEDSLDKSSVTKRTGEKHGADLSGQIKEKTTVENNVSISARECLLPDADVNDAFKKNLAVQDVYEVESAPVKCPVKEDKAIKGGQFVDATLEKRWQVILEQLLTLKEQILHLRAGHLSDAENLPRFVQGQSNKNATYNSQYRRKQEEKLPGKYKKSGLKQNEEPRRSVEKRIRSECKELPQGKSRSLYHVECSSDVLTDEGSNCFRREKLNVYNNAEHRSTHLSNVGATCDYKMSESCMGIELLNSGTNTTLGEPDTGGGMGLLSSNHKNEPSFENTKHSGVHESWPYVVSSHDTYESTRLIDKHRMALEEKVENCESRLLALEAARHVMTGAIETMKQDMVKTDLVHEIAQKSFANQQESRRLEKGDSQQWRAGFTSDLLKGCLSFTTVGYKILGLLSILVRNLKNHVGLVEEMDLADKYFSFEMETSTRSVKQDEMPITEEPGSQIDKVIFLWSTSLTWMNSMKERSGTAFSGWDI